jgi:hypothetical protein
MTALLITFYSIISFLGKFREFLEVPMRDNFQYGSNFTAAHCKTFSIIFSGSPERASGAPERLTKSREF